MNTRKRWLALGCLSLLLTSVQVYAGGPLLIRSAGVPFLWPNGGLNIPFNPDQGGLGPFSNGEAVTQTSDAFGVWAAIPSASATHLNAGPLPVDVDETNFLTYLQPVAPDGLSAIVYDEDGAIFTMLFGPDSGVLGFAGPEWIDESTGAILEGVSFLNGGALMGPDAFTLPEFMAVQVHEFGHYQNLAHTVVNGQIAAAGDHSGPSPFNTFPAPPGGLVNRIETMYPFLFANDSGGQATPHADDIAIFSSLYPEPTFAATTGTITGSILGPNGTTPLTGVNVIARNVLNPYDDAVSAISSDFTRDYSPSSPFTGRYTLRGLTPGATYAVYVDQINTFGGQIGFSTPPRNLPGPEEFYNGPLESSNAATDLPNVFTPVAALPAVTVPDVDIIFNNVNPPGPIAVGDETSTELFLKFPFKFCGESFDSVFVNSNGNLTFGAGHATGFSESPNVLLTGLPRIAGLWDDLNPAAGGSVSYSETSRSITISFTNVPEFVNTGANTFAFTLFAPARSGHHDRGSREDSSRFTIAYGDMSAADGLAGYSCGGLFNSGFEQERDLSRLAWHTIDGEEDTAIFETFTALDNDLDNRTLRFIGPEDFRDPFEPNDSATGRRRSGGRDDCDCDRDRHWDRDCNDHGRHGHSSKDLVSLPFSTVNRFSAIDPFGGDVDFFRFRAKAGEILAIETVPGRQAMDTFIGLFDSAGNLLIANDDSGAGLLSRLLVQLDEDGTYAVGVTTFGDAAFTGEGGTDSGRYVLNISSYTGTLIAPGDDGSVEVPLGFSFPFQGTNWSSVFVNGNGNLTFGAGNADFTESVAELLSGPPRIAPLWDDLSPQAGLVIADPGHKSMTIHFVSVPEFLTQGTNYFSVKLDYKGDVDFDYLATNRSDALVGLSQGGGAADPGPADLSEARSLSPVGTTYETFLGSFGTWNGVDLSFGSVEFKKKKSGHGH